MSSFGRTSSDRRSDSVLGLAMFAGREFITSNYHDVFHRRLMQMLVQGSSKECAEA